MGFHLGILDHLEKASPNQSSAQNIGNMVNILCEETQRCSINDVFGKCLILVV